MSNAPSLSGHQPDEQKNSERSQISVSDVTAPGELEAELAEVFAHPELVSINEDEIRKALKRLPDSTMRLLAGSIDPIRLVLQPDAKIVESGLIPIPIRVLIKKTENLTPGSHERMEVNNRLKEYFTAIVLPTTNLTEACNTLLRHLQNVLKRRRGPRA